jgi:uncharacterized protein (DUF608 family)
MKSNDENSKSTNTPNETRGMSRRRFLATTATIAGSLPIVAGPFTASSFAQSSGIEHYVPVDKKLSNAWVASLFDRGLPGTFSWETINVLGMPVGGIGAGQMYVTGDGELHCWSIYNKPWPTNDRKVYQSSNLPGRRLEQGFAMRVKQQGKRTQFLRLNREDFPDVSFVGEYPLSKVLYEKDECPVKVELTAYSPFIPLNAKDSAIPATIMEFTLTNVTNGEVDASLAGWMCNPVGPESDRKGMGGKITQRVTRTRNMTRIDYIGTGLEMKPSAALAKPEVFADFEGTDFGDWKVEGDAFENGPSEGRVDKQRSFGGYKGKRLANSFNSYDSKTGKLTSKKFKITRPYINLLVGGGSRHTLAYVRLMVEGREVGRLTGKRREDLYWNSWYVDRFIGKKAHIEIVDKGTTGWGHIHVDHIEFADSSRTKNNIFTKQHDFGTFAFCMLGNATGASADIGDGSNIRRLFWERNGIYGSNAKESVDYPLGDLHCGALGDMMKLKPGESRTLRYAFCWHFPNRKYGSKAIGNYYTNLFSSASAVADYVVSNYQRLSGDTFAYHDAFYNRSSLPHWLLERIGHTPSILATGTVHWRKNGRLWGWEGVGCCAGTCTHVWNYEHAVARLFPQLERSMREMQDLDVGLNENGLVNFRGDSHSKPTYAADGQAGTVLKCYREHQMSKDDAFLKRNWTKIKKVLEYQISRDANGDGIIEDDQHNTYDIEFHGANTMVGSLYLAALRAGEEMALLVGDGAFAKRCRKIFESGSKYSVENLYDGEYFIQDDKEREKGRPGFRKNYYGNGCLSDQLFGQGWAHQVGLGYIYPKDKVRSALEAIYKYNWTPDVMPQNEKMRPLRWFARKGDAGLFTCTWPKGPRPGNDREVRFRNEVWTGIEYQVAGNMICDGMVAEALSIMRGIHDRHDGAKHNPWNEVECGDHYARAMAAWGCYLALCGFAYDGPARTMGFSPCINRENFRAYFNGAEGWGDIYQTEANGKRVCGIELKSGRLYLSQLTLDGTSVSDPAKISVTKNGKKKKAIATLKDERLVIDLGTIHLSAGEALQVSVSVG